MAELHVRRAVQHRPWQRDETAAVPAGITAWSVAERLWHGSGLAAACGRLGDPLRLGGVWNLSLVNNASLLLALAAAAWLWRDGKRALAVFVFGYVLMPWSTGTLMSMGRYVLVCLPVYVAMAAWLAGPRRQLAWLVASAVVLAWMSGHFALGHTFAGA